MKMGDSVLVTGPHTEAVRAASHVLVAQMERANVPANYIITLMWCAESPEEFEARVEAAEGRS